MMENDGMKFSTRDNDNDYSFMNMASFFKSPWWWNTSSGAALNGVYEASDNYGPYWFKFNDDAKVLTATAMKLHQIPQ